MGFKPGQLRGSAERVMTIVGPDQWRYTPHPTDPLTFIRPNGQIVALDFPFLTDLGSTPAFVRFRSRLSKGYYNIAYLFHDAQFKLREQNRLHLSHKQANLLCAEIITTLQKKGYNGQLYKGGWLTTRVIYSGIASPFGKLAWKRAGLKAA